MFTAAGAAEFQSSQAAQIAHVVTPPYSSPYPSGSVGAMPVCTPAAPFFNAHGLVLSRPAHLRDYQSDAAEQPFRSLLVRELAPAGSASVDVGIQHEPPTFTSAAEQQWLQQQQQDKQLQDQRDQHKQAKQAAAAGFKSKLGFREPDKFPPQPAPLKKYCHQDGVSNEFFWHGTGKFASENGTANAQMYYRLARPLAGRMKTHYESKTTPAGYAFTQYYGKP